MSAANPRRRRINCAEEPGLFNKIWNGLRTVFCLLPDFPSLILSIIFVYLASLVVQKEYNSYLFKEYYKQLLRVNNIFNEKLENIENGLVKIGKECGVNDILMNEYSRDELIKLIALKCGGEDLVNCRMTNWACSSIGGRVVRIKGTETCSKECSKELANVHKNSRQLSLHPKSIIKASNKSSKCWGFIGEAQVLLKLASPIYVTHISVEHFPKNLIMNKDLKSVPRLIIAKGYRQISDNSPHVFGVFEYNMDGEPLQTFPIQTPSNCPFQFVELNFKRNQGNTNFTCVYKVKVHGRLTNDNKFK